MNNVNHIKNVCAWMSLVIDLARGRQGRRRVVGYSPIGLALITRRLAAFLLPLNTRARKEILESNAIVRSSQRRFVALLRR